MKTLLTLLLIIALPCRADELHVAVASNFKPTLQRINATFESETGHRVLLSSASTGALHNQIRYGAPFHLFFSADRDAAEMLQTSGQGVAGQRFCYAVGKLALVGGSGTLNQLADAQTSLAIANPATAPYGRAALQVLDRQEYTTGRGRKLVRGANVAQAYQYWHSGSTDLALLPASLTSGGTPVPTAWHEPIEQHAVLLQPGRDNPAVSAYLNWLRSDTVHNLIIDAGYDPCP